VRLRPHGTLSTPAAWALPPRGVMDLLSKGRTLPFADASRLKRSLCLLVGFLLGCVVAAVAVSTLRDWAWTLPVVLSGAAIALLVAMATSGRQRIKIQAGGWR
jgi:hypothetical protein